MAFQKSLTALSIALLAGISLVVFSASPIISAPVRVQIQTLQIAILILIVAVTSVVGAVAASKRKL